jgi:large subunit ribosomal protein L3
MCIGLLGTKIGITQIFNEKGNLIPITIIKCGPCYITQIKEVDTCGYSAIQVGYLEIVKKTNKLHNKGLKKFHFLKEYKLENVLNYTINQQIDTSIFKESQYANISSVSIGKGYAGNIKRNHFTRGPMSHGSKHHRLQGSIGSGTTPGRVFPGKKMSGHLGSKKITIKNLEIINIYGSENIITVKGSIAGKKGSLVNIKNKI